MTFESERWTNENRLIRQYLPKGQSMVRITQSDCLIAEHLNNRPKERLRQPPLHQSEATTVRRSVGEADRRYVPRSQVALGNGRLVFEAALRPSAVEWAYDWGR